ncbi:hypothetical protein Ddc_19786 [Ditylenchus destructor]|nr:hypothetical protein Ddc_19786 [Ditylenchus destructor]
MSEPINNNIFGNAESNANNFEGSTTNDSEGKKHTNLQDRASSSRTNNLDSVVESVARRTTANKSVSQLPKPRLPNSGQYDEQNTRIERANSQRSCAEKVGARLSSPISSTEHSAFSKYHKIDQSVTPVADPPIVQLRSNSNPKPAASSITLAAPYPNPTILRQDGRNLPSGSKSEKTSQYQTVSVQRNGKAPLAVCDEDDEDLNLNPNEIPPVSRSRRFENRISQILEDLHLEAESLRQLQFSTSNSKRPVHMKNSL